MAKAKGNNGKADRGADGRFLKGWKGGPGDPFTRRTHALRKALFEAVDAKDVHAVMRGLIKQAAKGDVAAAKVLLDRIFGRAPMEIKIEDSSSAMDAAQAIQRMLEHYGSNGSAAGGNGTGTITRIAGGNGRN